MSLREAVEEIVEEMDRVAEDITGPYKLYFSGITKQLKIALKASEGEAPSQSLASLIPNDYLKAQQDARKEFMGKIKKIDEEDSVMMVIARGGPADGINYPCPSNLVAGSKVAMADGSTYVYRNNVLEYSP